MPKIGKRVVNNSFIPLQVGEVGSILPQSRITQNETSSSLPHPPNSSQFSVFVVKVAWLLFQSQDKLTAVTTDSRVSVTAGWSAVPIWQAGFHVVIQRPRLLQSCGSDLLFGLRALFTHRGDGAGEWGNHVWEVFMDQTWMRITLLLFRVFAQNSITGYTQPHERLGKMF